MELVIGEFDDAKFVTAQGWHPEMQQSEVERLMLVFNAELTQHPEGVPYKILHSVVRLHVTDNFLGTFRKVSGLIFERGLMLEQNGETDICSCVALPRDFRLRETPNQVVEASHHVLNRITQHWYEKGQNERRNPSFVCK